MCCCFDADSGERFVVGNLCVCVCVAVCACICGCVGVCGVCMFAPYGEAVLVIGTQRNSQSKIHSHSNVYNICLFVCLFFFFFAILFEYFYERYG